MHTGANRKSGRETLIHTGSYRTSERETLIDAGGEWNERERDLDAYRGQIERVGERP